MAGENILMNSIFQRRNLIFLPFILLFITAFFLETSMHRVVFYLLSPFLIAMIVQYREERNALFSAPSFFLLCGYLLFFCFSAFWGSAPDPYNIFRNFVDAVTIFVFCASTAIIMTKVTVTYKSVLAVSVLCLGAAVIYALIYYAGADFNLGSRFRGQGRFENPIHLSAMLSLVILFLLSIRSKDCNWLPVLTACMVFLLFVLTILTQTRSSLVALAGCLVLALMTHSRKTALFIMGGAAISALLCYLVWGQSFADLYERGDTYRLSIWAEALSAWKDHKILGYGISTEPTFASIPGIAEGYKSTHNVLIGHLYFGGIAGILLFLSLASNAMIQSVRAFLTYRKDEGSQGILARYTVLSIAFCIITSMFNFAHYLVGVHIHWLIFWLPFALAWYWDAHLKARNSY